MSPKAASRSGALGLKGKALQWLAQREHSRKELAQKLRRWQQAQARQELVRGQAAQAGSDAECDADGPSGDASGEDESSSVQALERVLDQLAHAGLLSDERFVESRLNVRKSRFGNRRIEHELKQHGLVATPEQLAALQISEADRALAVLRTRTRGDETDPASRQRQALKHQRFLAARGFSPDAIRHALRQRGQAPDEDDMLS